MSFKLASAIVAATPVTTPPVVEEEEYYSSWSLFLVCILLVLSLLTSYYLQIKRIRAVHETLVSIFAGMFVGLVIRLAPGTMIRDMLVSVIRWCFIRAQFIQHPEKQTVDIPAHDFLQLAFASHHSKFRVRTQTGKHPLSLHLPNSLIRQGKLLSKLWLNPHLCLPRNFHILNRCRVGAQSHLTLQTAFLS